MKTSITIIITLISTIVFGQKDNYKILLDSAKILFNGEKGLDQEQLDKFDYDGIVTILKKVIELKPENVEARYFLGYTYSRINSRDGRGLNNAKLELVKKSSEQFEMVNNLTPKYTGEIIVLDPYSKLTSEWGSMAMTYWHHNKNDSAIWAFREGKRRGGFGSYILEFNKKVLDACSPNSILISSGDNSTIPLWYLQIAEGYRKDIKVVDVTLLNTKWYPALLAKKEIVKFDLPNDVLDTLDYVRWSDSIVTINNFSWVVYPSYEKQYLLRGDRILLSLLKQNKFKNDIYFTISVTEEYQLSLKDYLTHLTIVEKVSTSKVNTQTFDQYKIMIKNILDISKFTNINSTDELRYSDNFRYDLIGKVDYYLTNKEKEKAKELMRILDKYGNENKVPYLDERGKNYVDAYRKILQ